MPFLGVCFYYGYTPKYNTETYLYNRLLQLLILTIIIPILSFRVLKRLKLVSSIMAGNVLERRIPYAIGTLLNLYICTYVLRETREPELHFFFVGITFSSIAFLILSLLRYKASLHMAGIGGLTMFIAALSLHFHIDFSIILGALLLINGVVASSRLHTESHNHLELIIGWVMGFFPQFMMIIYWV